MMPSATKSSLWLVLALATLGNGGPVRAQGLARQVERAPDGWVVFRYAIDPDVQVCRGGGMRNGRSWRMTGQRGNGRCTAGLAEARLRVRGGVVTDIEIQPPESPVSGFGSRSDDHQAHSKNQRDYAEGDGNDVRSSQIHAKWLLTFCAMKCARPMIVIIGLTPQAVGSTLPSATKTLSNPYNFPSGFTAPVFELPLIRQLDS